MEKSEYELIVQYSVQYIYGWADKVTKGKVTEDEYHLAIGIILLALDGKLEGVWEIGITQQKRFLANILAKKNRHLLYTEFGFVPKIVDTLRSICKKKLLCPLCYRGSGFIPDFNCPWCKNHKED